MAKLILVYEDRTIGEYELNKEQIVIGRKPECDIQIDNLAVSSQHAKIITILNDSFLEDMNSTNGTYVRGALVKKHALQDGDVVGIGKHTLEYVNQNASSTGEFPKTMIIRPDADGLPESTGTHEVHQSVGQLNKELRAEFRSDSKEDNPRPPPVIAASAARLQVLTGANTGKELELKKALTTIGRPGTQVAAITRRPQGYFIIHVESGNNSSYPTVNGEPIGSQASALKDHDVVEIAGVKMEFFLS